MIESEYDMKLILTTYEIYIVIRGEILNFTYLPGTFISESELTKRFGLSRTPIREILKKLEYEGLVNIIPNKGTQITPIDFKSVTHFMYSREKLEVGLIEDLIPLLSQSTIAQLTLIITRQQKALQSEEPLLHKAKMFYELDNEFHKYIYSTINKVELWDYFIKLLPDYARFRAMIAEFHTQENLETLLLQHKQILNAIIANDMCTIKKIYKDHLCGGMVLFQKILQEKENYFIL